MLSFTSPTTSPHDVGALLSLWRDIAHEAKLHETTLAVADEWPVIGLQSAAARRGEPAVYLSTGVHGDEAGSAWGLAAWARDHIEQLRDGAFTICPCLNPVGLRMNTRTDGAGLDLNRRFHLTDDPLVSAWQTWIKQANAWLGLCLHEDYDAIGCYVYELSYGRQRALCEPAIAQVQHVLPRDSRSDIDGQRAENGIIHRAEAPSTVKGPEAIVLKELGCDITLTFETPSELAIPLRVLAHQTFVQAALDHLSPHRA